MKKSRNVLYCVGLPVLMAINLFTVNVQGKDTDKTIVVSTGKTLGTSTADNISGYTVDTNNRQTLEFETKPNVIYKQGTYTIKKNVKEGWVTGKGFLRWEGWPEKEDKNGLTGNLYVPYIKDEVYTSMKLPSEVQTCMTKRTHGQIFGYKVPNYTTAVGIGAVYQVEGTTLPDEFNIYIGKIAVYDLVESDYTRWKTLSSRNTLKSKYSLNIRELPWGTKNGRYLTTDELEITDKYFKIHLKKEDFQNKVLHFWGERQALNSEDLLGVVAMYQIWTDTPEVVGCLSAAIGVDLKDDSGEDIYQIFSGRNYEIKTWKRNIIGHSIPDDVYSRCVKDGLSPSVCLEMFKEK